MKLKDSLVPISYFKLEFGVLGVALSGRLSLRYYTMITNTWQHPYATYLL